MTAEFYVYILSRPDGTPFYVGMGSGDRVNEHEAFARRGERSHKSNVIRKIWADGLDVGKRIESRFATREEASAREVELIAAIGRKDMKQGPLVNRTPGGDGVTMMADDLRQEHREKVREAMSRPETKERCRQNLARLRENPEWVSARRLEMSERWSDPQQRADQSERIKRHFDNPDTRAAHALRIKESHARPEVREKMRAAKLGRPRSAEANAKTAAANRGRKHAPEVGQRISAAKKAAYAERKARGEVRRRYTEEQAERMRELRGAGATLKELCAEFACSQPTVSDVVARRGVYA